MFVKRDIRGHTFGLVFCERAHFPYPEGFDLLGGLATVGNRVIYLGFGWDEDAPFSLVPKTWSQPTPHGNWSRGAAWCGIAAAIGRRAEEGDPS